MFELPSFFNSSLEPWIGKVVSQKAQKAQINGMGWGHRFKVRIMGTYSENDNVPDKDCHYAMVMLGVTDGSGAANRMKSVKITQNDIVFGFFFAPDQNFPVITGVMGRTPAKKNCGGKFGVGSGHTDELKPGGTGKNEFNQQDNVPTQGLGNDGKTGSGTGKEVNNEKLEKAGLDPKNQEVNTNKDPIGLKKFDFDGLDQESIKEIVNESKIASDKLKDTVSSLKDTIIEEAPFDELKDVAERLTPELKNVAESLEISDETRDELRNLLTFD
tara:strand:+ start:965 stop:1780 length:816 start_codon:yes stop_codon:yes gene_type:complete